LIFCQALGLKNELFADLDEDFFESGAAGDGFEDAVLEEGDHAFFHGGLLDGDGGGAVVLLAMSSSSLG